MEPRRPVAWPEQPERAPEVLGGLAPEDVETDLERGWDRAKNHSTLAWEKARHAARDAWERARTRKR